MNTRIMVSTVFVIVVTLLGGLIGGWVGKEIGRISPDFVTVIAYDSLDRARPDFRPDRFGMGLGAACGLFFGAGASVVLIVIHIAREVWLARIAAKRPVIERSGA